MESEQRQRAWEFIALVCERRGEDLAREFIRGFADGTFVEVSDSALWSTTRDSDARTVSTRWSPARPEQTMLVLWPNGDNEQQHYTSTRE